MQIDGEGIHDDDFVFLSTHDVGGCGRQGFVVLCPGQFPFKVAFYPQFLPVLEFFFNKFTRFFGLEAQGVAAKIQTLVTLVLRKQVLIAEAAQGVLSIHLTGEIEGGLKGHLVWFKSVLMASRNKHKHCR